VGTLRRIQEDLLGSRDNLHIVLSEQLESLMERSRETVLPKLQQISALLNDESDNKRVIAELKGTVNDELRPLMSDISDRASLTLSSAELELVGKERVRMPDQIQLKQVIRPFITTAYLLGSWMFIAYYFFELSGLLYAIGAGIAYAASLLLIRALVPNRSIKRGRVILALVIISILAQVGSLFIIGLLPLSASQSVSIPIILFATGIFTFTVFTYLFILDTERIKLEVQIAAENRKLSKEVTVFEQRLWVFKRKWLFMLHGTVQSALTAALTRLQTFSDNDPYQSALVRADLERAEKALSCEPETNINFNEAVLELKQAWQGVCAVTVEVDLRADRALQSNQGSAYCVNEILKEAIGNAVRHGGANAVRAVITRIDDDVLDIEIQNDGKPLSKKWKKGIGSRMLDDITTDWTLRHSGRLTTLTARLPI
jgi:anti-sigma regulatory factor (Ser/Thr protein kinase)